MIFFPLAKMKAEFLYNYYIFHLFFKFKALYLPQNWFNLPANGLKTKRNYMSLM